jgi:hypothetical protein
MEHVKAPYSVAASGKYLVIGEILEQTSDLVGPIPEWITSQKSTLAKPVRVRRNNNNKPKD